VYCLIDLRRGELNSKTINEIISELNRKLYEVIIDEFKVPKEAITNIVLKFDVDGDKIRIEDISIEIFDRDEILSNNVTREIKNRL